MIDHCPTMELFSIKQMKVVLIQVVSCCVYDKPPKNIQPMHGIIPYMFDCWPNLVVHLLLPCKELHDISSYADNR